METSLTQAWQTLASRRWLRLVLLGVGTGSAVAFPHAPLAALAAVSGLALRRGPALGVVLVVWTVNQGLGFGLRGYPLTAVALTWGALMGLAAALATLMLTLRPPQTWQSWGHHWGWSALAVGLSFVLYQFPIGLAFPLLADGHSMDGALLAALFRTHLLWAGPGVVGYNLLLWQCRTTRLGAP